VKARYRTAERCLCTVELRACHTPQVAALSRQSLNRIQPTAEAAGAFQAGGNVAFKGGEQLLREFDVLSSSISHMRHFQAGAFEATTSDDVSLIAPRLRESAPSCPVRRIILTQCRPGSKQLHVSWRELRPSEDTSCRRLSRRHPLKSVMRQRVGRSRMARGPQLKWTRRCGAHNP